MTIQYSGCRIQGEYPLLPVNQLNQYRYWSANFTPVLLLQKITNVRIVPSVYIWGTGVVVHLCMLLLCSCTHGGAGDHNGSDDIPSRPAGQRSARLWCTDFASLSRYSMPMCHARVRVWDLIWSVGASRFWSVASY